MDGVAGSAVMSTGVMFMYCCHEYDHGVPGNISKLERLEEDLIPYDSCPGAANDGRVNNF